MKTVRLILVTVVLPTIFTISCTTETPDVPSVAAVSTCFDGIQNGNETGIDCGWFCSNSCFEVNGVEGEIVAKVILDNSFDYKLTGPLIVRDGGILEIREGTVIRAVPGKNAYIAIAKGGKIYVYGKADNPVIMTSDSDTPAPGDWGGLVLCGKAPTNTGNLTRSGTVDIFYGGDEPLDSSGVLRYLRVEFTGAAYDDTHIFNGISFYGVGSQTSVEYVQSYNGLGDGFGIYGGTVNSKWLVVTKTGGNAFSMTDGWNGTSTFYYASGIAASGIKMANNDTNTTATPRTTGQISNISIIGPVSEGALNYTDGGGDFTLDNIYTSGLDFGIKVGENAFPGVDDGYLNIAPIQFDNVATSFEITNYSGANTLFYSEGNTVGAGNSGSTPDWAMGWSKGF